MNDYDSDDDYDLDEEDDVYDEYEDDDEYYGLGEDLDEDHIAGLDGSRTIIYWDEDEPIFDDDFDNDF